MPMSMIAYFAGASPRQGPNIKRKSSSTSSIASGTSAHSKSASLFKSSGSIKSSTLSGRSGVGKPDRNVRASESETSNTSALTHRKAADDPDVQEAKSVWRKIQVHDDHKENVVLAVVKQEHVGAVTKHVRRHTVLSRVVVTTPELLQETIDRHATKVCRKLYLFASTAVGSITYHISNAVRSVSIGPCGKDDNGSPSSLTIDGNSTYCGFRTYLWDLIPADRLPKDRELVHLKGCNHDMQHHDSEALGFISTVPTTTTNITEEDLAQVRAQCESMQEDLMSGPSGYRASNSRQVRPGAHLPPSPASDSSDSWFERWKGIIAVIIGAGAGAGTAGSFMWCSAGGVFIKGPLGFSLAAGYFNFAVGGGVCLAAGGAALTAGAAFYFIPWERVFDYVKHAVWRIWEYVKDIFSQIWEKIKSLASNIMAEVRLYYSQGPKRMEFVA